MKILLYRWGALSEDDILEALEKCEIQVESFKQLITDYLRDEKFIDCFKKKILESTCDYVFSFDYFPVISEVCKELSIPYISYVFDSPHLTLFCNNIFNKCNYIFVFDRILYNCLKSNGVNNAYYMPLAVNVHRLDGIIRKDDSYRADISFVGSLYKNSNFYDKIKSLPQYLAGYFDGIMEAQKNVYGYNLFQDVLKENIMREVKKYVQFSLGEDYWASDKLVFSSLFLNQKVTSMERIAISEELSCFFDFNLYTNESTEELLNVVNKGPVDYQLQMPQVFYNSKINLNITLRSIESGMPLRALDIMGCRGFLMTNYQADILELFEPDKDFVYYENIEDLIDKANFYINNDAAREKIAESGYGKVKELHSYEVRVKEILSMVSAN